MMLLLLGLALLVRAYRLADLLGFYFDQGRDAQVIWNLWHQGKLFLIGPTTGVEGIFLGPFYYYLIAPFYLFGGGDPVWPAVWLAALNVAAIGVVYVIGRQYFDRATALLASGFMTFSYYLVTTQRWLANPNPLPLFAGLAVWALLRLIHGATGWWLWLWLGLSLGLSLQLEAASAIFFLPATFVILLWQRRHVVWAVRPVAFGLGALLATVLPQVIFDFRHQHTLAAAFYNFVVSQRSFQPLPGGFLGQRLDFYWQIFTNKFVHNSTSAALLVTAVVFLAVLVWRRLPAKISATLVIWWLTPVAGLLFYHGNYGYVWDYYFTGVYPVVTLLIAAILVAAWRQFRRARGVVVLVVGLFAVQNLSLLVSYLTAGAIGATHVTLGPSLAAVDWVYQDAAAASFNVDVYVPPVVPYAYDYLFLWRGQTKYQHQPSLGRTGLLYTLYEVDPPHPERLQAWLDRQAGIGRVVKEIRFGGVTAQRRQRL